MPRETAASVIRLSDGHVLHVRETVQELRDRIESARRDGPLGIITVSEDTPNGVLLLVGHIMRVGPR